MRRVLGFVLKPRGRNEAAAPNGDVSLDEVRRDQERFQAWQRLNPSKTFKEYSAEQIETTLAEGAAHPSLGGKLRSGPYETAGLGMFENLLRYGLKERDTCVDYGCGTMRVGQHVVKYLGRRRYWGLDISPRLLEEARALIGDNASEKEPQLRVISDAAVAEAAAAGPDVLFSHRVLPHVHPGDLPEYFRNIMTIIGRTGQAIIDGKWSDGETVQYKPGSWAHSEFTLRALVSDVAGRIVIVNEKKHLTPTEPPQRTKRGVLRLLHESNAGTFP